MRSSFLLSLTASIIIAAAGCAELREQHANVIGNGYLDCLNAAADKEIASTAAGAEEIAAAAEARCWNERVAYRDSTYANYTAGAQTPEEMQLARDKADAYLRQFELDARRAVVSRVVARTYGVPNPSR